MRSDDRMGPDDYVVDETYKRDGNNYLLDLDSLGSNPTITDFESLGPNPTLKDEGGRALAEIAAVINRNARHLENLQYEMVITWLKKWKLGHDPARREGSHRDFHAILERVRNSAEQRELQRKTAWKLMSGVVFGALFLLSLAIAIMTHVADGVGWGWKLFSAVVTIGLFGFANDFLRTMQILAKEQDRRFGLESLRSAKTVTEVTLAGLFSYLPGTSADEPNFDEIHARRAMAKAREALTDALYCDPDDYLARHRY